jgi:hypothetical protein
VRGVVRVRFGGLELELGLGGLVRVRVGGGWVSGAVISLPMPLPLPLLQ